MRNFIEKIFIFACFPTLDLKKCNAYHNFVFVKKILRVD